MAGGISSFLVPLSPPLLYQPCQGSKGNRRPPDGTPFSAFKVILVGTGHANLFSFKGTIVLICAMRQQANCDSPSSRKMTAFIAYYRVSTDRLGASGLGLDAQRQAVARHIGTGQLVAEYTEVESGRKHTNRPQLLAALLECWKLQRRQTVHGTLPRLRMT